MKPIRIALLSICLAAFGEIHSAACHAQVPQPSAEQRQNQPNIIIIMADDLGFETIGANGGTSYPTPQLDKLASGGVRFTHCYAQPLCTPTRVQLMTGLYNVRNYRQFGHLEPDSVTFAHLLKAGGYATCIVGKWQLGQAAELPKKFGFDEHCLWQHTRRPPRYANPGLEVNGVEKNFTKGEYGPDIVNNYALDFIERHKQGPFFLYYPMILTHDPYQPTPDSPDWDPKAQGEHVHVNVQHFGEMVTYMDKLIGKVDAKLGELGIRENTLLIFLGDNGTGRGVRSRMGARVVVGGKGSTTAAGMHVPLIVSWPGGAASARVCDDLIDTTDFLPTLLDVAGVEAEERTFDGRSFLPQLRGHKGDPRTWIYSWYWPRPSNNTVASEFAFNREFKLYRSGKFVALRHDQEDALPTDTLTAEAAAALQELRGALEKFADARPAKFHRREPVNAATKKKKLKNETKQ